MILEQAIESVVGVTMEDLRGKERSRDRFYGRVLYANYSGLPKSEVARRLGKCYTTVMYYLDEYAWLYDTDSMFRRMADEVEDLI